MNDNTPRLQLSKDGRPEQFGKAVIELAIEELNGPSEMALALTFAFALLNKLYPPMLDREAFHRIFRETIEHYEATLPNLPEEPSDEPSTH